MATEALVGWRVRAESSTATGVVSFPASANSAADKPYAFVTAGNRKAALKVVLRTGATGHVIFVAPGTLGLKANEELPCSWTSATLNQHSAHQLFHTRGGQLAIAGLLFGLIGIGIDVSLKVGNVLPKIRLSGQKYAALLIIASVLQAVGLGLVFAKTFRRADF